jgi:hypothetical protein
MRKLGVAFGLLLNFNAFAEYGVNMTEGVTSVSRDIYGLHMMNRHTNQNNDWNNCPDQLCFGAFMKVCRYCTF